MYQEIMRVTYSSEQDATDRIDLLEKEQLAKELELPLQVRAITKAKIPYVMLGMKMQRIINVLYPTQVGIDDFDGTIPVGVLREFKIAFPLFHKINVHYDETKKDVFIIVGTPTEHFMDTNRYMIAWFGSDTIGELDLLEVPAINKMRYTVKKDLTRLISAASLALENLDDYIYSRLDGSEKLSETTKFYAL